MEFSNVHSDTECSCLGSAEEDLVSTYCLKTNKDYLRITDFRSKWENGDRPETDDCTIICGKKGKSMSKLTEDNTQDLVAIFKSLFKISPKYKPFLTKLRFDESAGVLRHTPSKRNQHHHDFYKSDSFDLDRVVHLESIPLSEDV